MTNVRQIFGEIGSRSAASRRSMTFLLACLISCLVFWSSANAMSQRPPGVVKTETGLVQGTIEDDVAVFKNIPYAASPMGTLRWRAPQRAVSWNGVRATDTFGPACPQILQPTEKAWRLAHIDKVGTSEDCLTLNIWAPAAKPRSPLPVMVYIHGGNYQRGSGSEPRYVGNSLVRDGVMLVTINYRIGALGRFAHPALSRLQADEPLGNYGILDQIAALEWVQRNIEAFGGDPGNVTIFGHSAGGVSVNVLMVSPLAKGLFHRAIAQGSGIALDKTRHMTKKGRPGGLEAPQEYDGQMMAENLGIEGDDEAIAEGLRALTTEEILQYQTSKFLLFPPVVDGTIIPGDIPVLFDQGKQHDVPYMAGANSYEWGQIVGGPPALHEFLAEGFLEGLNDEDLSIFGDLNWVDLSRQWFAVGLFLSSTRYLVDRMKTVSSPSYLYHFAYVQENLRGQIPGAPHGSEVPFVFDVVRDRPELQYPNALENTQADFAMGDLVHDYWIAFAKTGDPNGGDRPVWPAYDPSTDLAMVFDETHEAQGALHKETLDYLEERALIRRANFNAANK